MTTAELCYLWRMMCESDRITRSNSYGLGVRHYRSMETNCKKFKITLDADGGQIVATGHDWQDILLSDARILASKFDDIETPPAPTPTVEQVLSLL
jgi:hypothetical protein